MKNYYLFLALLVFGVIYLLMYPVSHFFFAANLPDTRVCSGTILNLSHLQWNSSNVFKAVKETLLAGHFDLYLILFSPFSLLFGSYTLLVLQIIFLLLGGAGVYRYFMCLVKGGRLPLYAALYFWLFFGVIPVVAYGSQCSAIAACLIPWLFYFLKKRKIVATGAMMLCIVISRDDTSLWLAFICLGLILENRKDPFRRNWLIFSFLICIWYYLVINFILIPGLSVTHSYFHFNYSFPGNNFTAFHTLLLISGLPLLVLKPQYLFMLIPIYFQKMFHDNSLPWGYDGLFTMEFGAILAIGIFSVIRKFRDRRLSMLATGLVLAGTLICTIRFMASPGMFSNQPGIQNLSASPKKEAPVRETRRVLSHLPVPGTFKGLEPDFPR